MKYFTHYTEEAQTKLFNRLGAFFAFSNEQFEEQFKAGTKYVRLGGGMFCPKQHVNELISELDNIQEAAIKQDIQENGKEGIIRRELSNYECVITMDVGDAVDAVAKYGYTEEDVLAVWPYYFKEACEYI